MRNLRDAPSIRRRGAFLVDDEIVVGAERTAPRAARHWVMRSVAEAGIGGASNQVVELLTAELVSNAVLYGARGGEVRVRVTVDGPCVRIAVRDDGPGRPQVQSVGPTAPRGRGLALVDALSTSWGTLEHDRGKTVWFEVDTDA